MLPFFFFLLLNLDICIKVKLKFSNVILDIVIVIIGINRDWNAFNFFRTFITSEQSTRSLFAEKLIDKSMVSDITIKKNVYKFIKNNDFN